MSRAEPVWEAEPIEWRIDEFTQDNPFAAELIIDTSTTQIALPLDPSSLNALHDALAVVRAAQRAAVLGAANEPDSPTDTADSPAHLTETDTTDAAAPDQGDTDEPATTRTRGRTALLVIGTIVGLAMLYSVIAGAILI